MTNPAAPIEAVSSQRSEEIEPKAGIAIANRKGQFAPKEREVFIKIQAKSLQFDFRNLKFNQNCYEYCILYVYLS
ncbi:hypothetical protein MCEGE10_02698 [Flavobacteriaceae bacterium]